jgi:hypothetical protein
MKLEIRGHSISKSELVIGTATLIGPVFVFGAKSLIEQITKEQISRQRSDNQDIPDNVFSGEASEIFREDNKYAH